MLAVPVLVSYATKTFVRYDVTAAIVNSFQLMLSDLTSHSRYTPASRQGYYASGLAYEYFMYSKIQIFFMYAGPCYVHGSRLMHRRRKMCLFPPLCGVSLITLTLSLRPHFPPSLSFSGGKKKKFLYPTTFHLPPPFSLGCPPSHAYSIIMAFLATVTRVGVRACLDSTHMDV